MSKALQTKPLRGEVSIPGDKSITHRAVMLSALAEGESEIIGYLPSQDCERTISAFQAMGIEVLTTQRNAQPTLQIKGRGLFGLKEPADVIDCGNSGTTMRLMAGLLAGQKFFSVLSGDASLRSRPMKRIVDPLRMMGAEISGRLQGQYAPLAISGKPLSPIEYTQSIASAQVKSAVLLAGLSLAEPTTVYEPARSRDHTERMFQHFGIPFERKGEQASVVGGTVFSGRKIAVPGDISSAAFFLVAGTIVEGSELTLRNVGVNPTRTGILDILLNMGADIKIEPQESTCNEPVADLIIRSSPLRGIEIGGELILRAIDEFPVLCIAAARAQGETVIRGARELRVKESDRIESMSAALTGMGITVETYDDGMRIEGRPDWLGCDCKTAGDHRIAMSMSVADLLAAGGNRIDDVECINTSFPGFIEQLAALSI